MKKLIFISILSIFALSCEKTEDETTDQVSLRSEEIWKNHKFKSLLASQFNLLLELSFSNISNEKEDSFFSSFGQIKSGNEIEFLMNKYDVKNKNQIISLYNESMLLKDELNPILQEIQDKPELSKSLKARFNQFASNYKKLRISNDCGFCQSEQTEVLIEYWYYFVTHVNTVTGLAIDPGFRDRYRSVRDCFETCSGSAAGGGGGEFYLDPDNIQ